MSALPRGWINATIGEITRINPRTEGPVNPDLSVTFVPMQAVSDKIGAIVDPKVRPFREVARGYTRFKEGDVIFAKITPCMENGKSAVVRNTLAGLACGSTEFYVLRPQMGISPDFIWHYIRQRRFRANAERSMTGAVGHRRVPPDYLEASSFVLPPLREQSRIVEQIDNLSAKSARARERLDHIPRLVEKYKQAVLMAAFQGRLTKEWRGESRIDECPNKSEIKEERSQLLAAHGQRLIETDGQQSLGDTIPFDVPNSWRWERAEAVCGFITKGTTPSAANMGRSTSGVPFLKVYNLTFDGIIDFSVDPTYVSLSTHKVELKRSRVVPGDVLMNIVGPPLGKVGVVSDEYPEWNINQAIAVFRPVASLSSSYLSKWFLTDMLANWAASRAKATSGQSNLTLEICRNLPVPFCGVREQTEIVRRIDVAFAWIDRLAAEATSARKLIDHFDQAVLAKAFRGELVPQDPNDEPASALLERIRAERAAAPAAKRGRRKASA